MYTDWLNTYKKTQYKHILCKHRIILRAFINRIYLKTSSMAFCASISLNEIQHSKLSLEILSPPFRSFNRLTFFFVYDVERRTQRMSLSTGLRHFFVPTVGANATLLEIVSAKSSQYFSTVSLVPVCLPPPPPREDKRPSWESTKTISCICNSSITPCTYALIIFPCPPFLELTEKPMQCNVCTKK